MAKGRKTGGRGKGVPNKATAERSMIAERVINEASMKGHKLAKEVLNEFMILFAGMAAVHQPLPPGHAAPVGRQPDEVKFEKYARLAMETAAKLAPYQSPTFRAVVIAPPPDPNKGSVRKKFSVGIFDGQGRAAPKQITVKPNSSVTSSAKN